MKTTDSFKSFLVFYRLLMGNRVKAKKKKRRSMKKKKRSKKKRRSKKKKRRKTMKKKRKMKKRTILQTLTLKTKSKPASNKLVQVRSE